MASTVLRESTKREGWVSDGKPHPGRRMTEREFVEWVDSNTRAGVSEYWVIDPYSRRIETYILNRGGKYQSLAEEDGKLHSGLIKGLYIRPRWIFADKQPRVTTALREMGLRLG